jgi:hypothetical protein
MQQDYYSVLASVIMTSARDNAQMRRMIYELARSTLGQQLDRDTNQLGHLERAKQLLALETAIEQIEADLAQNIPRQTYSRAKVLAPVPSSSVEIIPPTWHLPWLSESRHEFADEHPDRPTPTIIRWTLTLIAAAILGVVAYIATESELHKVLKSRAEADQNIPANSLLSSRPSVPIIQTPGAYGVYALANGQLTELEPLQIKVPDHRIAISGTISSPSTTKLPNGRNQFIVFRRDLVNNAPEKVVVRVVAQVMRASAFGHAATTSNVGASWVIRDISYEMKVAPVEGNPAMILIRPADADFSFPAGRYALVLKTVAYDFSVDGPITDLAQCVERTDESNAPAFAECRKR